MATETAPQLAPGIQQLLDAVRRRIRRYVWLEGLTATVAVVGVAFWLALAADWLFEPARPVRHALLGLIALVAVASLGWLLLRRVLVRLSDHSMAILLERRFGNLQDSLVTAVELTGGRRPKSAEQGPFGQQMLAETCEEAWRRSRQVDVGAIFDRRPLVRAFVAAGAILLSIAAAAVASPDMLRFGMRRLTTLTDEPWPRKTHLRIEGFANPQREEVVARGMEFQIHVQAEAAVGLVVPQVVEVRSRDDEGKRDRAMMVREGVASTGSNSYQDYRYTFGSILSGVTFDVVGGDARLRGLRIRVVESPSISLSLSCEYPAYMKRAAAEIPVTGVMPLPVGTRVTVRARATKDLRQAQIDYLSDGSPQTRKISLDGAREFDFTVDHLLADQTLSFSLVDTDGVGNRAPIQLALTAVADEAPQVDVRLEGIGSAITPQARLPLVGHIDDDYGVQRVWLEHSIDEDDPNESPLAEAGGRSQVDISHQFEVAELGLKPGQKLLIGAKAADNRSPPAAEEPNVASGERFLLDVVSNDQLLALLETRELNLRQRFETIIQEMTDTRDSLVELEFSGKGAPDREEPDKEKPRHEADDAASDDEPNSAGAVLQRNLLRVERAEQNGQKNAEETRGVAVAFDRIRAELVNNRIDTEELRIRLKDRIADPLNQVVDNHFTEFGRRLANLKKKLPAETSADLAKPAIEEADTIILALQKVRDQMLELESFNEAVELLREIIAAQEQVSEETKSERSKKLRSLLEDDE
ncbi:MAG TPA: hypothetical protein VG826_25400 [Pirellulales bacterium]|nr:hypothetical protein [Pirellulales bacterium]